MTPLQILVLALFTAVTFANTFLVQPDLIWAPVVHAAVVSTDVALFWLALNLRAFSELGKSADIAVPPAPIDAVPQVLQAEKPVPVAPAVPAPSPVQPPAPAAPAGEPAAPAPVA